MNIKDLFNTGGSERAVSPVIGVILMVAITVILAAVIGTFVLGLGDQVQQTSPNAQWDWDESGDDLTLTHSSGDSVNPATLSITGDTDGAMPYTNVSATTTTDSLTDNFTVGQDVTAGDSLTFNTSGSTGNAWTSGTVRLVWTAEGGGSSSTLTTYEYSP